MTNRSLFAVWWRVFPLLIGLCPVVSQSQVFGPPAGLPNKGAWKLVGGQEFSGIPTGFGYRMLLIQRRLGSVYVNGEKVTRMTDNPVLEIVCNGNGINNIAGLKKHIAKQPNAQIYLPYCTLQYSSDNKVDEEVPLVMLDATELTLLKAAYDAWYAAAKRDYEERLFRQQQLANQQAMLQMQQRQLQIQQNIAHSSWVTALATENAAAQMGRQADAMGRQADAAEKTADELEELNREMRYR